MWIEGPKGFHTSFLHIRKTFGWNVFPLDAGFFSNLKQSNSHSHVWRYTHVSHSSNLRPKSPESRFNNGFLMRFLYIPSSTLLARIWPPSLGRSVSDQGGISPDFDFFDIVTSAGYPLHFNPEPGKWNPDPYPPALYRLPMLIRSEPSAGRLSCGGNADIALLIVKDFCVKDACALRPLSEIFLHMLGHPVSIWCRL